MTVPYFVAIDGSKTVLGAWHGVSSNPNDPTWMEGICQALKCKTLKLFEKFTTIAELKRDEEEIGEKWDGDTVAVDFVGRMIHVGSVALTFEQFNLYVIYLRSESKASLK